MLKNLAFVREVFLFTLFMVVCISCETEKNLDLNSENTVQNGEIATSSYLQRGTSLSVDEFAVRHIDITNELFALLENEENANFQNFPFKDLERSRNLNDFSLALSHSGVLRYNEISNLVNELDNNYKNFNTENRDFNVLSLETKQGLVREAIIRNLTVFSTTARSCADQLKVDKQRCNDTCNVYGSAAIVLTIATGGWGVVTIFAVMVDTSNCLQNAREDYADCIK